LFKDALPAPRTSTLITRYEQAGAVPFGKTTCPEFGLTTTTESKLWGQTQPMEPGHERRRIFRWRSGRSGGRHRACRPCHRRRRLDPHSGVLLRSGGTQAQPLSHPSGPGHFEGWFGASVANVVSRSVRDTALFLDAGQGHEAGSAYWSPPLLRPYVEELQREPGKLRVAVVRQSLTGAAGTGDCDHAGADHQAVAGAGA
jgi:amidase